MPVAKGRKCSPYNFRFIQDDPLKVWRILWPKDKLATFQEDIAYSYWFNKETNVAAGNMLGKDFTTGKCIVIAFLTRHPCRIVTTSSKEDHLRVLWGEINNAIKTSKYPLEVERGGPLYVNHQELRKWDYVLKDRCPISYVRGMVASDDSMAAMGGHHVANIGDGIFRTVWVADEASGVKTEYYETVAGWANRVWSIGNTWDCDNYFRHAFEGRPGTDEAGGDIPSLDGKTFLRKNLTIDVEASPNVRLARAQIAAGKEPTGEIIVPGLKGWHEYQDNLRTWDPIQQCIKLFAKWYRGKEVRLFPQEWLDRALQIGRELRGSPRKAEGMGVDPAEGGDKTAICVVDKYGIIELWSDKTPDTASIQDKVIEIFKRYNVHESKVYFDSGGGGKQHVDNLVRQGYKFHAIAFGEGVSLPPQRSKRMFDDRVDVKEDQGAYTNRRSAMYGEAAILFDPFKKPESNADEYDEQGNFYRKGTTTVRGIQNFGIPPDGPQYGELVRQLAAMPKKYIEGKLYLPPKSKRGKENTGEKTLTELLGRSPDEADAFVLAVYAMTGKRTPFVIKGFS